jgi:hypothetical protein
LRASPEGFRYWLEAVPSPGFPAAWGINDRKEEKNAKSKGLSNNLMQLDAG